MIYHPISIGTNGLWERIHDIFRRQVGEQVGKEPEPNAGSIDSQFAKAAQTGGTRGYDAGKKICGIKRHILVDTLGLVLAVVVHPANIQDRDGAKLVVELPSSEQTLRVLERDW